MTPPDGRWLVRFSTRSSWDGVHRAIQRRKFHATLPTKLDRAEEEWHKTQPPAIQPPIQLDDLHIRAPWFDDQETDPPD